MKDPLKPRDKITQKMTRDGAITENQTTGETERISKRTQDAELQKTPEQQAVQDAAQLNSSWGEAPHLRHLALRALRSAQGVSAVLVGMRRTAYVADVMAELERKAPERSDRETWKRVKALRART